MISKKDYTIENSVDIFCVKDIDGSISGRFFDPQEALALCKRLKVSSTSNLYQEKADIIWINGGARILGHEIRSEHIPSSRPSAKPPISSKKNL